MKLDGRWRFDSPDGLEPEVVQAVFDLVLRIATQADQKALIEQFKRRFAGSYGAVAHISSSRSWAESDLRDHMYEAANNAPLFIEAFWETCEGLRPNESLTLPDAGRVNRVLAEHGVAYRIDPPEIVFVGDTGPVPVPERFESLDEQAQRIIHEAFATAERLLGEGQPRQAVQEVLWLMETVSTAFRGVMVGDEEVVGKYFNKIAETLKRGSKGTMLEQALSWMTTMHGYLSSPTGGGVRHGMDLRDGVGVGPGEGRLLVNLVRSYVSYLVAEHARLTRSNAS